MVNFGSENDVCFKISSPMLTYKQMYVSMHYSSLSSYLRNFSNIISNGLVGWELGLMVIGGRKAAPTIFSYCLLFRFL